jgi:hypothetical protein
MENPSPQALAVRRYRERVKQRKLDAQTPSPTGDGAHYLNPAR